MGFAVCVIAAIIGSVLLWATVFGATVYGFEGDGLLTLLIAIAAGGIGYYYEWNKCAMLTAAVAGAVIARIALFAVTGVAAVGVYLTLFAGLGLSAVGLTGHRTLP